MLSNFYFKLSSDGQPICKFTFMSPTYKDSTYVTGCTDSDTGEVSGYESTVRSGLPGFSDPDVVFKDFISSILSDPTFLAQSKETFGVNAQIFSYFRLYMNDQKQLIWEGVFSDSNSGKSISIQKPAMKG